MTFERSVPGTGIGPEPVAPPAPVTEPDGGGGEVPVQVRLQILSTEHWSLLATRSLAWNESFSRAGMFLTTLSGALVALALVAQGSGFSGDFATFALVVLPITLFVGVTTILRLGAANTHDAICVKGMNRIRGAYLEIAPGLERYFVMSAHDDGRGSVVTMGVEPNSLVQLLAGTPTLVMVLNATLAAVIGALVVLRFNGGTYWALGIGAVVFVATFVAHLQYGRSAIARYQRSEAPAIFPSPPEA
jgi:hypothetical protein